MNARAKVPSSKTTNNNKPVEPKRCMQKPDRPVALGQRFSPKKSVTVHEKPNTPRSCLRWIPTGRTFKIVGLRWIPIRKMFTKCETKVDSATPNGSTADITNPYKCKQILNVNAGSLYLSACTSFRPCIKERLRVWVPKRVISHDVGVQTIQA